MGCSLSIVESSAASATKRSKKIDKEIRAQCQSSSNEIKILLLGAGESGKSTLLKQTKILYGPGYSEAERLQHRPVVLSNAVQSLQAIVRAMGQLGIGFASPEALADARRLFTLEAASAAEEEGVIGGGGAGLPRSLASAMRRLWADAGVQQCLGRSRDYRLNDSAEYYLASLERLCRPDYLPTEQDVLRARVRTPGIAEATVACRGGLVSYRLVDVGGQQSERKKWIHCFEGVAAVLFTVALSEYDQLAAAAAEDQRPGTSRLAESLRLFDSVCACQWFASSAIVLLLNKADLFRAKIPHSPLTVCFPEYTGPSEFGPAAGYVRTKFEAACSPRRSVHSHFTCAIDTDSARLAFDSLADVVAKNQLAQCGGLF